MSDGPTDQQADLSAVLRDRREKLGRIRDAGIEPFPHEFSDREEIAAVRAEHEGLAAGAETESRHRVAGRIAARRGHGKNAFIDSKDERGMSPLMKQFMAGLLTYAGDITYFLAPYINSYKRFQAGTFAPTKIMWSEDNRTAGFRLCGEGTKAIRMECRIGGADQLG